MKVGFRTTMLGAVALALSVSCSAEPVNSTPPETTAAESGTEEQPIPTGLVIGVEIAHGSVTPTNERYDTAVGEPVTVEIDSDTQDELHVHSVPEHSFDVEVGDGQSFQFTVDVPGQVALELHHADRTIATLVVRP